MDAPAAGPDRPAAVGHFIRGRDPTYVRIFGHGLQAETIIFAILTTWS